MNTRFVREDEWYGWAQKKPGEKRRYKIKTSRSLSAMMTTEIRRRRRRANRST